MADVQMPESTPCQFDAGGWSPCGRPSDNGWCSEHEGLKCRSCGEQSTRSCDAQMGGLGCGAPLCATCEHGSDGKHLTHEAAHAIRQREVDEYKARIASRTSTVRRMNDGLGVPVNLFELLKGDWRSEGYELVKVYFLELEPKTMYCFPAVFSSDKHRIVLTTDLHLLQRVWQMLEHREATLRETSAYVHRELGIGYIDADSQREREKREPERLLTTAEFEQLVKAEEEPFRWAFGLMGGRNLRREQFLENLAAQAAALDPTFTSATA